MDGEGEIADVLLRRAGWAAFSSALAVRRVGPWQGFWLRLKAMERQDGWV